MKRKSALRLEADIGNDGGHVGFVPNNAHTLLNDTTYGQSDGNFLLLTQKGPGRCRGL